MSGFRGLKIMYRNEGKRTQVFYLRFFLLY